MIDSNININLDSAKSVLETLQTANNKVELAKTDLANNPFKALCSVDPDLASNYITEYFASITDMYNFASNKLFSALTTYVSSINDQEQSSGEQGNGSGGGGGSGSGGSGGSGSSDNVPPIIAPVEDSGNSVNSIDTTSLNELNLNNIDGVVDTLKGMASSAGLTIDEMLAKEELADSLKEILLASQYIPNELKEQLKDADSNTIRAVFIAIMNGEYPEIFDINPLNLGIVYNYLMKIANEKGITVEELLTNKEYLELFRSATSDFGDTVDLLKSWDSFSDEKYQNSILKVYDGDGIGDIKEGAVNVVRTFVEYISDVTEIGAEELLTDSKYAKIIKTASQELAKTATFIDATTNYSNEKASNVVSNLFNGNNAQALGMDKNEVLGFKTEIDNLAKEKGVTSNEILTSSSYADLVKDTLNNSKNALEVGSIYSKASSTVSQNVAKNLYNTKFDANVEANKI